MTDDVTIKFTADTSGLQSGMQDAAASVNATAGTLRAGAAQIAGSFGALSAAYASSTAQKLRTAQQAGAQMLAMAREQESASYGVALTGVKLNQALVREQVRTGQVSHEQELASLLALEDQREAIERRHLQSLIINAVEGSKQYETYQLKLVSLTNQSALRREQIELSYNREVYADYRRTFHQIGSSVSSAIMGMIQSHETLRQAGRKVLLSIIQEFIQARIKMVADWAAGVATQVATTQLGETTKTMAVTTGVAARTAAETGGAAASVAASATGMIQQIVADARAAFAGVFAFLAPVLGPAAAGPAAAAMGTVTGMASFDVGAWDLPQRGIAMLHPGELVMPAGAAQSFRDGISGAGGSGQSGGNVTHNHTWNNTIHSNDPNAVVKAIKDNAKGVMSALNDGLRRGAGAHLGVSRLG